MQAVTQKAWVLCGWARARSNGAINRLLQDGLIEESEERPIRKWMTLAAVTIG
jgi:hypothetical protein